MNPALPKTRNTVYRRICTIDYRICQQALSRTQVDSRSPAKQRWIPRDVQQTRPEDAVHFAKSSDCALCHSFSESASTIERYGPDALAKGSYVNNCLIARRLLERGVRFVQLMHAGWDHHGNLHTQLEEQCKDTEGPSAALVRDLEERGMLEDTLVIWAAEFGRTPFGQGDPNKPTGRDHFGRAFSWWMAGGGVKKGHVFGATILHLCGIDHERLTFRYQGRQYRLTDLHGRVVTDILA